jgi:deoxycytidylate deaminase
MNRYFKLAVKNALANNYDEFLDYHLCAVLVSGGSIISVGFNKRNTNAFVEHYTDLVRGANRTYCLSTHAEMDAIVQARAKTDLRGSKMYIARILAPTTPTTNKGGRGLGLARPCKICQEILSSYGIKKAFYTIDDQTFGVMSVASLEDADKKEFFFGNL